MATSSTAYGVTAPSGLDPFPIESVLAKIVGENNPANASNLLDLYQVQNQTSQGNYNYNLNQQHEFAKQQLAQQLQENYMKYGQEALKTPGGLSLLGAQTGGAALAGLDPGQLETNLRLAQAAKTAQEGGAATASLTTAGFQPEEDMAKAFTAGLAGPRTAPVALQVAAMHEAGSNARHASSGGDVGVTVQGNAGPAFGGAPANFNVGKRLSAEQAATNLKARGFPPPEAPGALPDRSVPPAAGASAPPPPNRTPLPNAPASTTRAPAAADGAAIRQRVEAAVENTVRTGNEVAQAAYKDITAGKIGGRVNIIRQDPDGKVVIKGKTGQEYRMTP